MSPPRWSDYHKELYMTGCPSKGLLILRTNSKMRHPAEGLFHREASPSHDTHRTNLELKEMEVMQSSCSFSVVVIFFFVQVDQSKGAI